MNDIQENIKIDEKENEKRSSDLDDFYRGAYRRGARRKTKGTASLVITIILLSVIVLVGLLFVVGTFVPVDLIKMPVKNFNTVKSENVQSKADNAKGFTAVTDKFEILTPETLLADSEEFLFADGIISYSVIDLNQDGEDELLMISSDAYSMPLISVFENQEGEIKRNAYYSYTGALVEKNENAKSEIYISNADGKSYLCIEKYCMDDFSWQIEVLSYDGILERVLKYSLKESEELSEDEKTELSNCMIGYTSSDYSEGSELKMNGDTEGKILLCSFESVGGKLEVHMN